MKLDKLKEIHYNNNMKKSKVNESGGNEGLETFAYSFGSEFYYNLVHGGYLKPDLIPDEYPELKQAVADMNKVGKKLEKIRSYVEEQLNEMGIETES